MAGRFGAERALAGLPTKFGRVGTAIGEFGQNAAEGAAEQWATNYGIRRVLPAQSLTEDVALNAVAEGVLGGMTGAVTGGHRVSGKENTPEQDLPPAARVLAHEQGSQRGAGSSAPTTQDVSTVVDGLNTAANRSALKRHLETAVRDGMLEDAARQQGVVGRAARALLTHMSERNVPPAPAQVMFSRSGEPSSKERSASGAGHVTDAVDWAVHDALKKASEVAPKMGFTPDREEGRVSYAEPPFLELAPQDAQVRSGAATERGVPMTHNNFGNPVAGDAQSLKSFWDWYSGDHAQDLRGNDAGGHGGEHAASTPAAVAGKVGESAPLGTGGQGAADAARGDHAGRRGAVAALRDPGGAHVGGEAAAHGVGGWKDGRGRAGALDQVQSSGRTRSESSTESDTAKSRPLGAGGADRAVHAAGHDAGGTGGVDAVRTGADARFELGAAGAGVAQGHTLRGAHRAELAGAGPGAGAGRDDAATRHTTGGDTGMVEGSPPLGLRFMRSGPVDSQGRPVVFFHGTREHFSSFDTDHPGRKDQGWLGRGVYGTSDPFLASSYSSAKKGNKSPRVMPLYFAVKNPFHADMALKERFGKQGSDASGIPDVEKRRQAKEKVQKQVDEFTQDLKNQGYDGVVLFDTKNQAWEIVAFDPGQVKSATGNTGAFDSANPDIRYSRASPPDRSGTHSTGNAPPREGRSVSGLTVAQVRQAIRDDIYHHEVDVYPTLADAPAHIQSQARAEGDTKVEGFFDPKTSRVALIAENIATPQRAREVARHELTGHYGMEGMMEAAYGKGALDQKAKQVLTAEHLGNKVLKELGQEVDRRQPELREKDPQRRGREIIALMAERNMHHGLVRWVMDGVRLFFKKMGWHKGDVTDAQVAMLLREARAYVQEKGVAKGSGASSAYFSRRGWAPDFPDAVLGHKEGVAQAHPDYLAAKAGDDAAALQFARDLVTGEYVNAIRKALPKGTAPTLVPVLGQEAAGKNRIPLMVAKVLGEKLGVPVEIGIGQIDKVSRTGSDGFHRLANPPRFAGDVAKGHDYLILDDTLAQGGTLAALKTHIEDQGGRVLLASALTGKNYSARMALRHETLANLRERYGLLEPWWREHFGHGFDGFTESEANFLLKLRDRPGIDALRVRVDDARVRRVGGVGGRNDPHGQDQRSVTPEGADKAPAPDGGAMFSRSGGSAGAIPRAEHAPSVHARASLTRPEGAAVRAALAEQFPAAQPGQSHAVEVPTEAGMRRYLVEPLGRAAGSRLPAPLRITQLRQSRAGALVAIEHYRLGSLGAVSLQGLPRKADATQIRAFDEYFVPVPQESMLHTGHGPRPPDPVEHAKADAPPREGRSVSGADGSVVGAAAIRAAATRSSNVTRTGVIRTNAQDWREVRDLWDGLGYGDILSPANRTAIARGRTPTVDEQWIRAFPEDAGLVGERIPMHHIGGFPVTIPLPATRHLDAHMPGGFRYNPGGPGSAIPFYPPQP